VLRGDVYRSPKGIRHEQHGDRYGLVVQADEFLPRSVVIVAPNVAERSGGFFPPTG
jgi:mRNA interferase MazF